MDSEDNIEQYATLAKSLHGKGLVDLISKATEEAGLYAFGELLVTESIQQLESGDLKNHLDLLKLFAYGTWQDYKENQEKLPALSQKQQVKLKQLTVATLAAQKRVLLYSDLMQALDLGNVRQLEDLLITECMYNGVIKGKLDQEGSCLYVEQAIGRDVAPEKIPQLISNMENWLHQVENLAQILEIQGQQISQSAEQQKQNKEKVEEQQQEAKTRILDELDRSQQMDEDEYVSHQPNKRWNMGGVFA